MFHSIPASHNKKFSAENIFIAHKDFTKGERLCKSSQQKKLCPAARKPNRNTLLGRGAGGA